MTDQEIDAVLTAARWFLRHKPTCAADCMTGKGCNCGLREWVAKHLKKDTV